MFSFNYWSTYSIVNTFSFKLNTLEQPPISYRKTQLTLRRQKKNFNPCVLFWSNCIFSTFVDVHSARLFKITKHSFRSLVAAREIQVKPALYNRRSALPSDTAATVKKVWLRDLGRSIFATTWNPNLLLTLGLVQKLK